MAERKTRKDKKSERPRSRSARRLGEEASSPWNRPVCNAQAVPLNSFGFDPELQNRVPPLVPWAVRITARVSLLVTVPSEEVLVPSQEDVSVRSLY